MGSIPTSPNPAADAIRNGIVSGVLNNGKEGYPRLEIDDFCQDNARLNLYLLALEAVQNNDNFNTNPWCWFQIQGIHGAPDIPWDGIGPSTLYDWLTDSGQIWQARDYSIENLNAKNVPPASRTNLDILNLPKPKTGNLNWGFCNHGSVLFPSWHRGYQAMLEQAVQAKMVEIADQFTPGTALWVDSRQAARSFRYPYWDFLRARSGLTQTNSLKPGLSWIMTVKKVRVRRPAAQTQLVAIDNPIYAYAYPGRAKIQAANLINAGGTWANFNPDFTITVRHLVVGAPTVSDNLDVQRALLMNPGQPGVLRINALREQLYMVLTAPQTYRSFATNTFPQAAALAKGDATHAVVNEPLSVESWHNQLHNVLGGIVPRDGTMTRPGTAGHDPVFPLHHGNVDRHYALWQAIWPDSWWLPMEMAASQNSYTTMIGTIETPRTPLLPFRKPPSSASPTANNTSTFWNSNDLRNHDALGYQYDPIPTTLTKEERKKAATYEVNLKYAWFNTAPDVQNSALLDPPPMDKVEAFTEFPPFVDDKTVQVNLFEPDAPPPQPRTQNFVVQKSLLQKRSLEPEIAFASSEAKVADITPAQQASSNNPIQLSEDRKIRTWTTHIRALRHCLATSFTIFIFLGDFPPSPDSWATSPSLVSALHQFVNHDANAFLPISSSAAAPSSESDEDQDEEETDELEGRQEKQQSNYPGLGGSPTGHLQLRTDRREPGHSSCPNCAIQASAGMLISDFAPLTSALSTYISTPGSIPPSPNPALSEPQEIGIDLQSLEPSDVVPFLRRNLHWRILRGDGQEIDRGELEGFKLFVTQRVMKVPETMFELPSYEDAVLSWDVTDGRAGGLDDGVMP